SWYQIKGFFKLPPTASDGPPGGRSIMLSNDFSSAAKISNLGGELWQFGGKPANCLLYCSTKLRKKINRGVKPPYLLLITTVVLVTEGIFAIIPTTFNHMYYLSLLTGR